MYKSLLISFLSLYSVTNLISQESKILDYNKPYPLLPISDINEPITNWQKHLSLTMHVRSKSTVANFTMGSASLLLVKDSSQEASILENSQSQTLVYKNTPVLLASISNIPNPKTLTYNPALNIVYNVPQLSSNSILQKENNYASIILEGVVPYRELPDSSSKKVMTFNFPIESSSSDTIVVSAQVCQGNILSETGAYPFLSVSNNTIKPISYNIISGTNTIKIPDINIKEFKFQKPIHTCLRTNPSEKDFISNDLKTIQIPMHSRVLNSGLDSYRVELVLPKLSTQGSFTLHAPYITFESK